MVNSTVETSHYILPEAILSLQPEMPFFRKAQTDHTSLNLSTKVTVPVFVSNNARAFLNPQKVNTYMCFVLV